VILVRACGFPGAVRGIANKQGPVWL